MPIRVFITGDRACFTRPEMKSERVSYEVPTPGALEGLLESVYWKPSMRYVIDQIIVFNPVSFINLRRNEVKSKVKLGKMKAQMKEAEACEEVQTDPRIYITEDRTQRASMILNNVRYGVTFHIELTGRCNEREQQESDAHGLLIKHEEIFRRRCRKGQCFRQPCLGCSEFPADICLADDFSGVPVCPENMGTRDLGFMLYKVRFLDEGYAAQGKPHDGFWSNRAESLFYHPVMKDGVIDVAAYREDLKC